MVIRQDGYALMRISDQVINKKHEFERKVNELYDDLSRNLGTSSETNKIWYGPRAEGCLARAKNARPTYDEMIKEFQKLADKISGDAKAWGNQQTSKY